MTNDGELPHPILMARSLEELKIKTSLFDGLFQIRQAAWQLDQDVGVITFESPDGIVASADAQIAGSYDTETGTWLWAWANPSVVPRLTAHATITREYGIRRGIAELTTPKMKTTEDKAWEFAALTCKLGGLQGAYRGPAGRTMVFITFGEVKLSR
jgi:hypothetical protein